MILPPRPGQILVFSCGHLAASSGMYSVIRQCAAVTTHLSAINVPPHPPWKKTSKNYPHLIFPPFSNCFLEVFGRQQSMATPQTENKKLNRTERKWFGEKLTVASWPPTIFLDFLTPHLQLVVVVGSVKVNFPASPATATGVVEPSASHLILNLILNSDLWWKETNTKR